LSPLKSHFVVQSYVPETAELTQFLQTFTPKRFLDNNPTLKNEMEKIRENPQNK